MISIWARPTWLFRNPRAVNSTDRSARWTQRKPGRFFLHWSWRSRKNILRATRRSFGGVMPQFRLSGMDISRTWHRERRFSYFLLRLYGQSPFWLLHEKSKTATYFLPRFSSSKRDIQIPQFKMARPKISQWFFSMPYQKRSIQIFYFSLFRFVPEKTPCGLKKTLFLRWDALGSPGLRWNSLKLQATATNSWN